MVFLSDFTFREEDDIDKLKNIIIAIKGDWRQYKQITDTYKYVTKAGLTISLMVRNMASSGGRFEDILHS
jgi:hypothetical protein